MSSSCQSAESRRRGSALKRGYVACIPCRTRKVRCVIDNEPPCAKCAREHRDCDFEAHEKSWKHREPPRWAGKAPREASTANAVALNATTQQRLPSFVPPSNEPMSPTVSATSVDRSPTTVHLSSASNHDTPPVFVHHPNPMPNTASPSFTEKVVSSMISGPKDALDILFDAANQPPSSRAPNPGQTRLQLEFQSHPIPVVKQLSQPPDEDLDLWDKCRFVRQGWFTAQEAVTYVDLCVLAPDSSLQSLANYFRFYEYFAPLSPIVAGSYNPQNSHEKLVHEEPMLCCTILMIASRYFVLPGAGGHSRSHFIHQRLWQYCELLIRRVMFGQEKHSTAKTRVLGTIESYILIADWHPRSVHFPPETEGWDGLLISPDYDRHNRLQTNGEDPLIRWREDVFEPSKRSERMTWMLLGSAVNLAYELGVFSETSSSTTSSQIDNPSRSLRIRKALYINVTQMANRLGCASLLPDNFVFPSRLSFTPATPDDTLDSMDVYSDLWMGLTRLNKIASAMFFPSVEYTKQHVVSGQYDILLQHFSTTFEEWREESESGAKSKQYLSLIKSYGSPDRRT